MLLLRYIVRLHVILDHFVLAHVINKYNAYDSDS